MSELLTFFRFCLVGAIGFAVDAGCTLAFTQLLGWPPALSRVAAFALAASTTWFLNRSFTFRSAASAATWLPYVLLTAFGAMLNFVIYMAWLAAFGTRPVDIFLAVASGSAAALALNYAISRKHVFAL
jgi:putative flippase GtrA